MNQNSTGEIAVVIVNYNSGELLERCVRSLAVQSLAPDLIMVVDNDSNDDSIASLEKINIPIDIRRMQTNLGFAAANNVAVSDLDGYQWIALLNPDAFPEKYWLENLMAASRNNPQYDAFASRMMMDKPELVVDGAGDVLHISGLPWRRGHGSLLSDKILKQQPVFSSCGGAALYRRQAFIDAGAFDEDYFCYIEDVDLGFRMQLLGYSCLYVPEAVVTHIGSATSGKQSDFVVYHGHRNLVWSFVKNMPLPLLLLLIPLHLLVSLCLMVVFATRGKLVIYLKAKRDALAGIPKAFRKRPEILGRRRISSLRLLRLLDYSVLSRH
jgi:GT2 family glycosyltransferase